MKIWNRLFFIAVVILSGVVAGGISFGDNEDAKAPSVAQTAQKMQEIRMPFIANQGQVDEEALFYAKTFGGTVFVTKSGEIVYSLPEVRGRDVPAGASPSQHNAVEQGRRDAVEQGRSGAVEQGRKAVSGWHGQAPLVRAESEYAAKVYVPLLRAGNADCQPDRVLTNALLAAYLPGLQKETTQRVVSTSMPPMSNPGVLPATPHSALRIPQSPLRGVALKETIIGAKIGGITGEQPAVTMVNYFTGNDKSKWKTNVPTYDIVNLGEVYKGIELSLKAYGNNVEKLFCIKPGASPEFIKVQLDGSKTLRVNQEGQLEADTELGLVKFTRPIAYQEIDGTRVEVDVEYRLSNPKSAIQNPKSEYGFTVASYDKTKDLIIDPLLASTFLGGAASNKGRSITTDTSGNVYVTGETYSTGFPTTIGAYDTSFNGRNDAFVSKLNSGLTTLLASTFLGGSSDDVGRSITLDATGNVFVTGGTASADFPTTTGAPGILFKGGVDVFVSKLDNGLTNLLASTFLGGSSDDIAYSITLDPTYGNVYVTGQTNSTNFSMLEWGYDRTLNGHVDAFVTKLDNGLTTMMVSTYLGGIGHYWDDYECGYSIALDASGNVYVTGYTQSSDFPTTSTAYDTSFNSINWDMRDVFVSKLNSELTSLLASTFLGGSYVEEGYSLALDILGNVYVTGWTGSTDFPTTIGAYDTSRSASDHDAFVSKLNGGLTALLASTYLGGANGEYGYTITPDASGNVFVAGITRSPDFPTTVGAYDTSHNGYYDVFVSKLNSGLTSLLVSTYLGGTYSDGSGAEGNYGISHTLDVSGNVCVTGDTRSTNFPTTSGAYDTSHNSAYHDAFVSKLDSNLSAGDTTPPTVASTDPGNNENSVAIDSVIAAAFSEEMDASTITTSTFYLSGGVTGTVSYDSSADTVTFTPYANLSNATTYTATITTGVKDVAGNNMAANYTWSFTTVSLCKAKSITVAPDKLTLQKNGNGNVVVTVKGAGGCLVEGVKVTATINASDKRIIAVSPGSLETDANGQAGFTITAKNKKGAAVVKFKASGLGKSAAAQVKVR